MIKNIAGHYSGILTTDGQITADATKLSELSIPCGDIYLEYPVGHEHAGQQYLALSPVCLGKAFVAVTETPNDAEMLQFIQDKQC